MIHHISLRTHDLERSQKFYALLGFEIESSFSYANGNLACWMLGPHGRVEIVQVPGSSVPADAAIQPEYIGYDHFALGVEELDLVLRRLLDGGAKCIAGPSTKSMNDKSFRVAFVRDPSGLHIEIMEEVR